MPNLTDPSPDLSEAEPTERFALQKCPRCAGVTAVSLGLATSACVLCGEPIEVAPLLA